MNNSPLRTGVDQDTIVAQATPPGRGGIAVVRVSGPDCPRIAEQILKQNLKVRHAHYLPFYDTQGQVIDKGIALSFNAPDSFTGEDILELQCHGGPVLVDMLIREIVACGARIARPGEFSERAFLNDKIDLAQAEAIADLIDAASEQAARSAQRSLQGAFSARISLLVSQLIALRIYVEAAIDFPEEEIDFLGDGKVLHDLEKIQQQLGQVLQEANRGVLMKEGMKVVLAGKPNAGKSSLMNALSGRDSAIVTPIAGTTRDLLREHIHLDGMPLHITDTAGLRESPDEIEREGVRRAWAEIRAADRILLLLDAQQLGANNNPLANWPEFLEQLTDLPHLSLVINKIDLGDEQPRLDSFARAGQNIPVLYLSAKTGAGVDLLREHLKAVMGYRGETQGSFTARQRHLVALRQAQAALEHGRLQLLTAGAGELLAEDLREAQHHLGEITGRVSADDLLGKIFSSFCIGK